MAMTTYRTLLLLENLAMKCRTELRFICDILSWKIWESQISQCKNKIWEEFQDPKHLGSPEYFPD